jgi:phage gp29-like protein
MAKKRKPTSQVKKLTPQQQIAGMSFQDFGAMMERETTGILTDYLIQAIGVVNSNAIFINQDRVMKYQTYEDLIQYDLYSEVGHDPHVSSVCNTLKIMCASVPWEVKPFSESARNKEIAKQVQKCFEGLDNFQQDIYEFQDAIFMGVSWSECIWERGVENRLKALMNRPPRRLQFDAVTREPKLRTKEQPFFGIELPKRKMIVHRASSTYENPFGDALAQNVYWLWLFKRLVLKYWASHLEANVSPVPYVQHPVSTNQKIKTEALEIARQIRQSSFGRVPENMKILFAEAKNMAAAGTSYKDFEEYCNDEITKAMLGQVLTTEGGGRGGSGSRALGDVHMDVLQARIIFYSNALASTLNSTVVKWYVDYNYAKVEGYPKFQFITKKAVDRKTEADIIKILHDAGYEVDHTYIEDVLEIPLQQIKDIQPEPGEQQDKSDTEVDDQGNIIEPKPNNLKEQNNAKPKVDA